MQRHRLATRPHRCARRHGRKARGGARTGEGVDHAGGRVLALIEGRGGPFADDWSGWRPDPGWPDPVLHAGALTLPAAS
jgi:hypothetical protein